MLGGIAGCDNGSLLADSGIVVSGEDFNQSRNALGPAVVLFLKLCRDLGDLLGIRCEGVAWRASVKAA